LLLSTACVMASIAALSSGFGIWLGNKPKYVNHKISKTQKEISWMKKRLSYYHQAPGIGYHW
jgi:hypothetical protein